ncbi:H-NS family nucleoid-associated regulatory protein [Propionivibrio sp.]|uniref:H-NS histone family protein n=1 Tax=Propionivibrio sp. TaxID=2212460 RepID=UPI003BF245B4
MATYKEIKRQIAALEKQAAEARSAEIVKIIFGIKIQITEYELTPDDLFEDNPKSEVKNLEVVANPINPAKPPKYMDPKTDKTWNGHGKPPGWMAEAIKKGKREDFLIAKVLELRAAKTAVATALKKAVKPATAKPVTKAPAAKKSAAKKSVKVQMPVQDEPAQAVPAPEEVAAP